MENIAPTENFHAFLSHSHNDAEWVEELAGRLEDKENFRVWLDRWTLIPGQHWQQEMARGLDQANCCIVCVSEQTPLGWFREEIQKALNRQSQDPSFRVIPLLLPNASIENISEFLELRTWVDFRHEVDPDYAFHLLVSGIKGVAPGRWPRKKSETIMAVSAIENKLRELNRLRRDKLVDDEIALEFQRELLSLHLMAKDKN